MINSLIASFAIYGTNQVNLQTCSIKPLGITKCFDSHYTTPFGKTCLRSDEKEDFTPKPIRQIPGLSARQHTVEIGPTKLSNEEQTEVGFILKELANEFLRVRSYKIEGLNQNVDQIKIFLEKLKGHKNFKNNPNLYKKFIKVFNEMLYPMEQRKLELGGYLELMISTPRDRSIWPFCHTHRSEYEPGSEYFFATISFGGEGSRICFPRPNDTALSFKYGSKLPDNYEFNASSGWTHLPTGQAVFFQPMIPHGSPKNPGYQILLFHRPDPNLYFTTPEKLGGFGNFVDKYIKSSEENNFYPVRFYMTETNIVQIGFDFNKGTKAIEEITKYLKATLDISVNKTLLQNPENSLANDDSTFTKLAILTVKSI